MVGETHIAFYSKASLFLFTCSVPCSCPYAQLPRFASVTLAADRLPFSWSLASSKTSDGKPYGCCEPDILPTRKLLVTSGCSILSSCPPSLPRCCLRRLQACLLGIEKCHRSTTASMPHVCHHCPGPADVDGRLFIGHRRRCIASEVTTGSTRGVGP